MSSQIASTAAASSSAELGPDFEQSRIELVTAVHTLLGAGVLSANGNGNASFRVQGTPHLIAMAAPGVLRNGIDDEPLVVFDLDGEVVHGGPPPDPFNKELHTEPYRFSDDVHSVIHTHSPYATGFAVAGVPLPLAYVGLAGIGQRGPVPVAPAGGLPGSSSGESLLNITATLETAPATVAMLLANHGLLAFGASIGHATQIVIALEEAARATLVATTLGGAVNFPLN